MTTDTPTAENGLVYGVRFRTLNCRKCPYRWIWKALKVPGSCPGCGARFFGLTVQKAPARTSVINVVDA